MESLAALEKTISEKAADEARRDVGAIFSDLERDLDHLGVGELGIDALCIQVDKEGHPQLINLVSVLRDRLITLVAREKALLIAEQILRKSQVEDQVEESPFKSVEGEAQT